MTKDTTSQYMQQVAACKEIYLLKATDYGATWRVFRPASLTDQLYIKAQRIRSIEEKGRQMVNDSIADEFRGLVNYSIMAIIQSEKGSLADLREGEPLELWYDEQCNRALSLMQAKNHDYGEAWRDMRVSSMTDLILVKLLRIKQIENNKGKTLISEGIQSNYLDIINYAIFALILLSEANH